MTGGEGNAEIFYPATEEQADRKLTEFAVSFFRGEEPGRRAAAAPQNPVSFRPDQPQGMEDRRGKRTARETRMSGMATRSRIMTHPEKLSRIETENARKMGVSGK